MARYTDFITRFVDVQYRAGDICLPASGTFVGDSGRSVFLEQHYEQHGQLKNFRWEIPYQCIVRLEGAEPVLKPDPFVAKAKEVPASPDRELQANAVHAGGSAVMLPLAQRPETA